MSVFRLFDCNQELENFCWSFSLNVLSHWRKWPRYNNFLFCSLCRFAVVLPDFWKLNYLCWNQSFQSNSWPLISRLLGFHSHCMVIFVTHQIAAYWWLGRISMLLLQKVVTDMSRSFTLCILTEHARFPIHANNRTLQPACRSWILATEATYSLANGLNQFSTSQLFKKVHLPTLFLKCLWVSEFVILEPVYSTSHSIMSRSGLVILCI